MTKLYEVPRNTWIECEGEKFFFHHIDGMYSYCETPGGQVVHLAAYCNVKPLQTCKEG